MGTISDLSALVNRLTGGNNGTPEHTWFWKDGRIAGAAANTPAVGFLQSLWLVNGSPSRGVAPGAASTPTEATAGSLQQTDPGGGRQKYLLGIDCDSSAPGALIIYDRLLHISGLSGTNTGAQTIQSAGVPALTRYTNGAGNMIMWEVYTQVGASNVNLTASYTNQSGTSGQTTQSSSFGGATNSLQSPQSAGIFSLADGDSGVRGVASVTLSATTGTAGNFGISVIHPIATIGVGSNGFGVTRDFISGTPELPEVLTNACLSMLWLPGSTTIPQLLGACHFVEA